jgi:protein-disulfide isomerase
VKSIHHILLAAMLLTGIAFAAIGDEPEVFLAGLDQEIIQAPDGSFESGGIRFSFEERGDAVYRVDGEGILDEAGIDFAASLIGQATGYGEGIALPVAEFFRERAHELVGQGRIPLPVEEYVLELELAGEEPHEVSFSVYLAEVPEDAFPPARHTLGPDDATFVIREFSDFQCPFCARYALEVVPVLKETLLARGDVRFEYHHFPLTSIHANAQPAAEAAECVTEVNDPEAFWVYHDALFERLQAWANLGDPNAYFVRLAGDLGLATEGVAECLENRDFAEEVREATQIAANVLGLRGTPTIFVNGYRIANAFELERYERMMDLIERFSD